MLPHELEQLWQEIQLSFDEGTFTSPEAQAKINRFMDEGPDALDYWTGKIKEAEALALGYAERLGKLKAKYGDRIAFRAQAGLRLHGGRRGQCRHQQGGGECDTWDPAHRASLSSSDPSNCCPNGMPSPTPAVQASRFRWRFL